VLGWRSTLGQWTIIANGRPCHTRSEGAGHWCPTAVNAIVEFQRISALWAIGRNTRPKRNAITEASTSGSSPFDQGHTNTARVETSDAIRYKEHPWKQLHAASLTLSWRSLPT
jgi:hypothetical protein